MRRHIQVLSAILICMPCIAMPTGSLAQTAQDRNASELQIISVDPVVFPNGNNEAPLLRITFPATGDRLPLVILSHGNRLSRGDYLPLVAALVRSGYIVIQPDHPDASEDGFAPKSVQPSDSWRVRVEQIRWIATHARMIADRTPQLRGRIDTSSIALVGHSFGGHSVALAMGAHVMGQPALAPIKGISAAVMLSPPGGYDGLTPEWKTRAPYLRTDWQAMHGPALIINGDKDLTPLTEEGPQWHNAIFDGASAGQDVCLMVVKDAGHYLGGIDSVLRPPTGDATPQKRDTVLRAVVTFLGARLDHRPADEARWAEQRKALACK